MNLFSFSVWAGIIQIIGALMIAAYVITATLFLIPHRHVDHSRLMVAEGVINSLSFMLSASLLRMIDLRTWQQILIFGFLLALRTFLKKIFVWEKARIIVIKGS
jgi:uncharacterized membrane protein